MQTHSKYTCSSCKTLNVRKLHERNKTTLSSNSNFAFQLCSLSWLLSQKL